MDTFFHQENKIGGVFLHIFQKNVKRVEILSLKYQKEGLFQISKIIPQITRIYQVSRVFN